jgi:L-amino acid N-acyltransferase YncA
MIRLATTRDIQGIAEVYNQAVDAKFKTGYTQRLDHAAIAAMLASHDASHPILVYAVGEEIAGWVSLSSYRAGRDAFRYTVEVSYFIHNNHQRQGIGTALLSHALHESQKLGYKTVLAIILDRNAASIRLAEKHGFEQWAFLPNVADFDGDQCNHVYYGKKL